MNTSNDSLEERLNNSLKLVTEQNKRLINFSYIVSHNLRSHTSNIKTIIDLLQVTNDQTERLELLTHLKTVSDSLDNTLHNLNEVVAIQTVKVLNIETINVFNYIEKEIAVLSKEIELKKASIINKVSNDVLINYNPAYFESIIFNFLSNAIKYSSSERQPVIILEIEFIQNRTVLSISDNGLGIDLEKNADKLFGLNKTFHGNKDAKGIGLFISKNQIEAMDGKIEVESTLNIGTTFKIHL
ncbi:MAG: HAMP domain-containing sensor histidine kinase [Bacteroidetes bacterium]|nr:HAMP domain-containing sensor histidine kinase [Bacteroidota bacterium]MCX7119993.1 HAMP domain-containing sensor histidine kinase [Legionellales bacterium]